MLKKFFQSEKTQKVLSFLRKCIKRTFIIAGIIAVILFILSFTDLPYYAYHSLGTAVPKLKKDPDVIVVLGGSGMPSPDGLIRTYYAAGAANEYVNSKVIIAHPAEDDGKYYQLDLMRNELQIRGVDSLRITYEAQGFNTHSQAENVARMLKGQMNISMLIVTSPEHMYRSVHTFKKAGFTEVGGSATFEEPIDEEQVRDTQKTPDKRVRSLALRYNMWSYMHYELLVLREYFAIAYYKMKGWI